jgi:Spy/CpxP family protein refolding chaperone
MKRAIVTIIAIAVLSVGAIVIFAQRSGPGGKHGGSGHRGMGMIFKKLDLTDEQKAQAKEIVQAGFEKNKSVFEAMKANREKMKAATANGAFDEAVVSQIAAEQGQLSAQLIVEKVRVKSQVFAILTDEQKAKATELEKSLEGKMKPRFGGKRGGFGGSEVIEE